MKMVKGVICPKEKDKLKKLFDENMKIFVDKLFMLLKKARKEKDTAFIKCSKNYMKYFREMVRSDEETLIRKIDFWVIFFEKEHKNQED